MEFNFVFVNFCFCEFAVFSYLQLATSPSCLASNVFEFYACLGGRAAESKVAELLSKDVNVTENRALHRPDCLQTCDEFSYVLYTEAGSRREQNCFCLMAPELALNNTILLTVFPSDLTRQDNQTCSPGYSLHCRLDWQTNWCTALDTNLAKFDYGEKVPSQNPTKLGRNFFPKCIGSQWIDEGRFIGVLNSTEFSDVSKCGNLDCNGFTYMLIRNGTCYCAENPFNVTETTLEITEDCAKCDPSNSYSPYTCGHTAASKFSLYCINETKCHIFHPRLRNRQSSQFMLDFVFFGCMAAPDSKTNNTASGPECLQQCAELGSKAVYMRPAEAGTGAGEGVDCVCSPTPVTPTKFSKPQDTPITPLNPNHP